MDDTDGPHMLLILALFLAAGCLFAAIDATYPMTAEQIEQQRVEAHWNLPRCLRAKEK